MPEIGRCFWSLTVVAAFLFPRASASGRDVLYEKQSRYHYVRVMESGSIRTLTFRRKGYDRNQSVVDMSDMLRPALSYYPLMFSGYLFVPNPRRVLIIGLGAGVLSRFSAHYFPEAQVDSIELDPEVVKVAKRFFGFEEGERQRVFVRDGRVQVKTFQSQNAQYDVIMLDAFSGGYVPFHLTTKEFFEECRSILSPDGALVVNVKPGWVIYQYQRRTLAATFPEQYAFGGASGDEAVVALPAKREMTKESLVAAAKALQEERKFSFRLVDVVAQFGVGPGFRAEGPIFTDKHVPANILRQQLDSPYGRNWDRKTFFARLVEWLRRYRLYIIPVALGVIILAFALRNTRRSRAPANAAPEPGERRPT